MTYYWQIECIYACVLIDSTNKKKSISSSSYASIVFSLEFLYLGSSKGWFCSHKLLLIECYDIKTPLLTSKSKRACPCMLWLLTVKQTRLWIWVWISVANLLWSKNVLEVEARLWRAAVGSVPALGRSWRFWARWGYIAMTLLEICWFFLVETGGDNKSIVMPVLSNRCFSSISERTWNE